MKFVCLVNPVSGRGRARSTAQALKQTLEQRGHQARILETAAESHIFRQRCAEIDVSETVICMGGDGTLLYFLNHASQYNGIAFFGMGTANVIGIEFGIPKDLNDYAAMLEADRRIEYRPGVTDGGTRFLMMAGFGIDGFILSQTSQRLKNRIGKFAFLPAALKALWRYSYPQVSLTLDHHTQISGSFGVISRIRHYGGAFLLAPQADPQSQQFQVILLHRGGFLPLLRLLAMAARGKVRAGDGLTLATAKHIALHSKTGVLFQLDGDLVPERISTVGLSDQSLPLIVPEAYDCPTP